MFLVGGPAFSGKTLLAFLLNQGEVICLDEPDFHNPAQSHRGLPVLQAMFPSAMFPPPPVGEPTLEHAVDYLEACEGRLRPRTIGMKTSDFTFVRYADIYGRRGYPTIAMMRDIRDALAESPLPPWVGGTNGLVERYERIWRLRDRFDLLIRYEDLVAKPAAVLERIGALLGHPLQTVPSWPADNVPAVMMKLPRHSLLTTGRIVQTQVGLWRSHAAPDPAVRALAALTGY